MRPPSAEIRRISKASSNSTAVSPATETVSVAEASPAASVKVPAGITPPKSFAFAPPRADGSTRQATCTSLLVSPELRTISNVKSVLPELPSKATLPSARIATTAGGGGTSSFLIMPKAESAPGMRTPQSFGTSTRSIRKGSLPSTRASPATVTVIVAVTAPGANVTLPWGNTLPEKSSSSRPGAKLLTAHSTVVVDASWAVSPRRRTVNT